MNITAGVVLQFVMNGAKISWRFTITSASSNILANKVIRLTVSTLMATTSPAVFVGRNQKSRHVINALRFLWNMVVREFLCRKPLNALGLVMLP